MSECYTTTLNAIYTQTNETISMQVFMLDSTIYCDPSITIANIQKPYFDQQEIEKTKGKSGQELKTKRNMCITQAIQNNQFNNNQLKQSGFPTEVTIDFKSMNELHCFLTQSNPNRSHSIFIIDDNYNKTKIKLRKELPNFIFSRETIDNLKQNNKINHLSYADFIKQWQQNRNNQLKQNKSKIEKQIDKANRSIEIKRQNKKSKKSISSALSYYNGLTGELTFQTIGEKSTGFFNPSFVKEENQRLKDILNIPYNSKIDIEIIGHKNKKGDFKTIINGNAPLLMEHKNTPGGPRDHIANFYLDNINNFAWFLQQYHEKSFYDIFNQKDKIVLKNAFKKQHGVVFNSGYGFDVLKPEEKRIYIDFLYNFAVELVDYVIFYNKVDDIFLNAFFFNGKSNFDINNIEKTYHLYGLTRTNALALCHYIKINYPNKLLTVTKQGHISVFCFTIMEHGRKSKIHKKSLRFTVDCCGVKKILNNIGLNNIKQNCHLIKENDLKRDKDNIDIVNYCRI